MHFEARLLRGRQAQSTRLLPLGAVEDTKREPSVFEVFVARRGRRFLGLVDEDEQHVPVQPLKTDNPVRCMMVYDLLTSKPIQY